MSRTRKLVSPSRGQPRGAGALGASCRRKPDDGTVRMSTGSLGSGGHLRQGATQPPSGHLVEAFRSRPSPAPQVCGAARSAREPPPQPRLSILMLLASLRGCEASPQRRRGRQSRLPLAPQPGAPFLLRFGRFLSSEASSLSLSTCDCQHPAWDSWIPGLWRGRRAAACPGAACTANNQVGTVSGRPGTEKETLPGLLPAWSSEDKPMPTRPCTTGSYQQGIPLGRSRGRSQRGWGQQPWGSASCVRGGQPRELCTGVMSRYRWPERSILWAMPS